MFMVTSIEHLFHSATMSFYSSSLPGSCRYHRAYAMFLQEVFPFLTNEFPACIVSYMLWWTRPV